MSVLQFKQKEVPHIAGEAFCFGCEHSWVAVIPAGTTEFECPNCRSMKGRFRYECIIEGQPVWTCHCGNQLFSKTPKGDYCPNCGDWL